MIRLLLADDHAILRQALCRALDEYQDMEVVAEVDSSARLLAQLRETGVDIVLLDISMPGPGMLESLEHIRNRHPGVRILILSTHAEDLYAVRAIQAGADGYIMKDRPLDELVAAIRRVYSGGKYISPLLAEQLAIRLSDKDEGRPHETLSDREFQVFFRLASGIPIKDIAIELSISPKTVNTYRSRILEKMALESNAGLIRYALKHGLVE